VAKSHCERGELTLTVHGKKWFCYGNKIRDNKYSKFFVAATKNFSAATKRFVDRT